jgi:hypothetical protein
MSYLIIANIIHIITNGMSRLIGHLFPIAELERARQTEDSPRTRFFASLAYFCMYLALRELRRLAYDLLRRMMWLSSSILCRG